MAVAAVEAEPAAVEAAAAGAAVAVEAAVVTAAEVAAEVAAAVVAVVAMAAAEAVAAAAAAVAVAATATTETAPIRTGRKNESDGSAWGLFERSLGRRAVFSTICNIRSKRTRIAQACDDYHAPLRNARGLTTPLPLLA
jgi:hypothetical protein